MGLAVAVRSLRHDAPDTQCAPGDDVVSTSRSLLRFITCGSVDDGKSTLIGRLLFEIGAIPDDTLAAMRADSARGASDAAPDYSLLVDGLQSEREQGITIDVAYRYASSARRAFIVADTPGHEQYTRNMATGASGADLAVILIDARKGVLPQTRRHSLIAALVGVRHVVVAINKFDLVGYAESTFHAIEAQYRDSVAPLGFQTIVCLPVSAREGDNVAARSARTPWYAGPTLLESLETIDVGQPVRERAFVLPVQWVNRPSLDFRGFSGTIASGRVRPGDELLALPSGRAARVARIVTFDGDRPEAREGEAVTLTLDRDLDLSRGDVLVAADLTREASLNARMSAYARLLVTADRTVAPGDSFIVQIGAANANARVERVLHGVDVASFETTPRDALAVNELGLVELRFDRPIVAAPYADLRDLGALILIDRITNATAAMGLVVDPPRRASTGPGVMPVRAWARDKIERRLGGDWRTQIGPIASWRLASAALFGLIVAVIFDAPALGALCAALDAGLRAALRYVHREAWASARLRREAAHSEEDGGGI